VTDLWRQQRACENAPGAAREHQAIPQVPPKTGTSGAATGVPGSCLQERKGGFASLLVFPLPPAGTRNKTEALALRNN
jgi:hypothetical protein